MSIVVIGSVNADLVMTAERAPDAGETLHGRSFSIGVGGKGLNQCAAIAMQCRDPSTVFMVGCIGSDANGELCLQAMRKLGINVDHIRVIADKVTGVAMIVVEDSGDNRILLNAAANEALSFSDIDACASVFGQASHAIFQLESPIKTVQYALERAQRAGICTVLNPAPATDLSDDFLSLVDILVPNETEASILSGMSTSTWQEALRAGAALLAGGVRRAVIITLGGDGCAVITREGSHYMPVERLKAVDTTAAGDSFIGGLAVKLAEGGSLCQAVRYGQKVAAITVTRPGALQSIPTRSEVEQ